jgi:hypothetical protein
MIKAFAVGFCTGAVAAWWFKESLPVRIDAWTSGVRLDLARRLRVVADAVEAGLTGVSAGREARPS